MSAKWKIQDEHIYEQFKIFTLRRSRRVNPRTGTPADFVLLDGLDWCNIIALTPRDEVVLVEQFRQGSQSLTLELPGGCVEVNEDPRTAALRELREETGYGALDVEPLGSFFPNPAMMSIKCHSFLARGVVLEDEPQLLPGEEIKVRLTPREELSRLMTRGPLGALPDAAVEKERLAALTDKRPSSELELSRIEHGVVLGTLALYFARMGLADKWSNKERRRC